ncbi:MAG: protein-disulfide reductase DsbD [Magnetococcales bacterium]|nr:protein-disulfide reductase DsbD [Magnetococcales bacterium]
MKRLLLLCWMLVAWMSSGMAATFLDPKVAFVTGLHALDPQTVELNFQLVEGYYLYRDKVKIHLKDPPEGVTLGAYELPPGKQKMDENFGNVVVYYDTMTVRIPVLGLSARTPSVTELQWSIGFQGCADAGLCYPPQTRILTANGDAIPKAAPPTTTPEQPAIPTPAPSAAPLSETDRIAGLFQGGHFWLIVSSFFGFGLLLSLTPCIFPMIPILSGIIVGQKGTLSRSRGFFLSLAYVLGMALTYAAVGVAAGLSGTLVSNALQTPSVLGTGAVLLVLLSLSMFGFYELQLPASLQSRVAESSNRLQGGEFTGVLAMGALSALIVGPCVAAPLAGALIYIGKSGDVLLGGSSLFVMALGMGVPLLLVGLSAGTLLPRAGAWMDAVKQFFGVLLLMVAVWMVQPVIPDWLSMLLWSLLLIGWAVHLGALEPAPPGGKRFGKSFAVVLLMAGSMLLIGLMGGSRDLLKPLAVFAGRGEGVSFSGDHLAFQRIRDGAALNALIAANPGRRVMLDFYADWCVSCKEMEKFTFSDPGVRARLRDVLLLQADVTLQTEEDKALLKRFGLFGPPAILFFDPQGVEQSRFRVIGYQDAPTFLAHLNRWIP